MGVEDLRPYLQAHWLELWERLLGEAYWPSPVRRVAIPKPDGGVRELGIPTVLDRFLQQALLPVLTPVFDLEMSASSYGFRPGRSAHQAVQVARGYIREGHTWVVVEVDLKQFFDQVNHDGLMARVARKVKDRRALRLPESVVASMASTRKGPWRTAQSPPLQQGLDGTLWKVHGLIDLKQRYRLLRSA